MTTDLCSSAAGQTISELDQSPAGGMNLHSILKDAVSPAFGATIIIIVTVVVSGSAYLCFLRYVCGGCCRPLQVAPVPTSDPTKVEEQV